LHAAPNETTPVTVLKPLAGEASGLRDDLESFMRQSHTKLQIVFGIGSENDSARAIVDALMKDYPQVDATLVVAGKPIGPNRKVNNLHYMMQFAKYDLLMICDDDVQAPDDFVARMVGEMKDPKVGLATATYWSRPAGLSNAVHGLTMATEFFPSVVTAEALEGLSFSLGPASIFRREYLDQIGGFEPLANYLAEDYHLGRKGRDKGWKIKLARESVRIGDFSSFLDFLKHQLRWSRTYRVCRPAGFFFSILTHGVTFAAIYVAAMRADPISLWAAGGLGALRMACSGVQIALRGPATLLLWWWAVPLRDLASTVFWVLSFLGNKVRWRENVFRLTAQGRLEPLK
jgi:ceramide glucosyltransferase